jgi:hypothetical protein
MPKVTPAIPVAAEEILKCRQSPSQNKRYLGPVHYSSTFISLSKPPLTGPLDELYLNSALHEYKAPLLPGHVSYGDGAGPPRRLDGLHSSLAAAVFVFAVSIVAAEIAFRVKKLRSNDLSD